MAVFEYRGLLVASGKTVHDVRDADNPKALRAMLKREGILLTEANEVNRAKNASSGGGGLFAFFRRVSVTDVAMMTRQLATLVGAGIPLVEAVTALTEQVEKEEMKRVLALVRDRLNEGSSLAKALEAHPKVFPPLYVNMVAAGEASGTLEVVLDRLSDFMESQARLKGKVSAAWAVIALPKRLFWSTYCRISSPRASPSVPEKPSTAPRRASLASSVCEVKLTSFSSSVRYSSVIRYSRFTKSARRCQWKR